MVFTAADTVRRNDHRFQTVNFLELIGLGVGRTCHATQLAVQAEIILEGDGGHGLVFGLNGHTFFGFHRLVQTIAPTAARHEAACEFVDDDNLTVLHHVMLVTVVDVVGAQSSREVVHQSDVGRIVKAGTFWDESCAGQNALCIFVTLFSQKHLM